MRKRIHRILPGLFGGLALLALAALVAARPLAGSLKSGLENTVAKACAPCELKVDHVAFGLLPPRVELTGLSFRQGDPRDSAVRAEADKVTVPLAARNLSPGGPWRIGLVRVSGLKVVVHEGDLFLKKNDEAPAAQEGKGTGFEAAGIAVSGASFTYRKDSPAGAAYLRLTEIAADISPFGNYGTWREKPVRGEAVARFEGSGEVELKAESHLASSGPSVDVRLRVKGQKLRELNGYFRPEEGVSLAGVLLDSESAVKVRGTQAEGSVMAHYEGLEVMFHQNRHRGALSALLTNLGAQIKLSKGNSGKPRSERESAVVTKRHARETVVSLILRTLLEAMLRVAT